MDRKDWLLLVIAAAEGDLLSPVQLQKSMFLLGKEQKSAVGKGFYNFIPYAYGPFCVDLYHDAEDLERQGLVSIHLNLSGRWREYRATPAGVERAREIGECTNKQVVDYVSRTVNWIKGMSFHQLVKEIYDKYPAYRKHSVFQD